MKKYKEENCPIIYEDETYIHSSHTRPKNFPDNTASGYMAPVVKGTRFIIDHMDGSSYFIRGAHHVFKSHRKTGLSWRHYFQIYKWLIQQLIPNLPPISVLIIDNALYHNVKINKPPTKKSTKAELTEWLTITNMQFAENMLKVQLYDLITANKSAETNFVIDNIMSEHGHSVLRLLPYHPDLH